MERTQGPCRNVPFALIALLCMVSLTVSGCGVNKSVLKSQIDELQHQVMRLKAENTNMVSRKAALDDKLLILEKRAAGLEVDGGGKHTLQVVRLRPDEVIEKPAIAEVVNWKQLPKDDGKRPTLSLSGAPRPSTIAPRPMTAGSAPLTVQGDNLGVVQGDGTVSAGGSPMELFQRAYRAFSNKNYDDALTGFSRFLRENPNHEYADNAMFWRGECFLSEGKALKAIGEYERLLKRFPRSEKSPSTLYRIGFVYDKMHDKSKAREYYFRVVDQHPGSDAARKASRRVALIQDGSGRSTRLLPTSGARR